MKFLFSENSPSHKYIHALENRKKTKKQTIAELIETYDIVVDECVESDLQTESDSVWCEVIIWNYELFQQVKKLLEWYCIKINASLDYVESLKCPALEVKCSARELVKILQKPDAEIVWYHDLVKNSEHEKRKEKT